MPRETARSTRLPGPDSLSSVARFIVAHAHVPSQNALGKGEATPLFLAAQCGHLGVVETLLAADADATLRRWEERPLEIAAEHGHTDIKVALIDSGSDVNSFGPVFGTTALQRAVCSRNPTVIDLLVKAGARIEPRDSKEFTPLPSVCQAGGLDVTRALLWHGADVNVAATPGRSEGQTPLHALVRWAAGVSGDTGRAGDAPEVVDALL